VGPKISHGARKFAQTPWVIKKKKKRSADEVIICLPIWAAINQLEVYCQGPPLACLVSYCLSFFGGFL